MTEDINANAVQGDDSFYLKQSELTHKYIKLQVMKDLLKANNEKIEQKIELLKKETDKLDKLHNDVWFLQNEMCEKVWNFSEKHDFSSIINNYPNIPPEITLNCECGDMNYEIIKENTEAEDLLQEIQKLKFDLKIETCYSLREDLIRLENELQNCKKEDPEIKRLKNEITKSKRRITNLKKKFGSTSTQNVKSKSTINCTNNLPENNLYSKLPITRTEKTKTNIESLKPVTQINNNLIATSSNFDNEESGFVRASVFIKSIGNETQFKNAPEKITIETDDNNTVDDQRKKKFVFKTQSLITKRHKPMR